MKKVTFYTTVALMALIIVGLAGCGSGSPSKVYKKYYVAMEKGDTKAFWVLLPPKFAGNAAENVEAGKRKAARTGGIVSTSETITGDTAVVQVSFRNGEVESILLAKIAGKWMLDPDGSMSAEIKRQVEHAARVEAERRLEEDKRLRQIKEEEEKILESKRLEQINKDLAKLQTDIYMVRGDAVLKNGNVLHRLVHGGNSVYSYFDISGKDVYIGGPGIGGYSAIWKNGDLLYGSGKYGIHLFTEPNLVRAGDDVYAAGYKLNAQRLQDDTTKGLYKNGDMLYKFGNYTHPFCIYVSGNDVYVGGFKLKNTQEEGGFGNRAAMLWKNGVEQHLSDGDKLIGVDSICVSGNDVYVQGMGINTSTTLLKNGVAQRLRDRYGNDLFANSIFSLGDDVYIVGGLRTIQQDGSWKWSGKALLKNGESVFQIQQDGYAFSLFISGKDFYFISLKEKNITIWKNGAILHRLSYGGPIFSDSDSDRFNCWAVWVSGKDVYVAGIDPSYREGGRHCGPTIWKNGVAHQLDADGEALVQYLFVSGNGSTRKITSSAGRSLYPIYTAD